ncbi:MAG: hypothetical protein LC795_16160 [Acidobacteria bacterium]|nr:hypothetical protein [Acidobacteriota bacterium]
MKRRIFSPLLLLLVAAPFAASAQTPAPAEAPAGVSVTKYNWRNASYRPGWDSSGMSADSQGVEDLRTSGSHDLGTPRVATPIPSSSGRQRDRAEERVTAGASTEGRRDEHTVSRPSGPRGRKEEYTYQVQIKNGGEATIEAVDWEYLFLDSLTGGEMARHRFQTFRRAKPGKSLTLSGTSASPPTRVVNAGAARKGMDNLFEERIVVRCVAYSDGTVRWRDGGGEADCADIKAAASRQASKR